MKKQTSNFRTGTKNSSVNTEIKSLLDLISLWNCVNKNT